MLLGSSSSTFVLLSLSTFLFDRFLVDEWIINIVGHIVVEVSSNLYPSRHESATRVEPFAHSFRALCMWLCDNDDVYTYLIIYLVGEVG